MLLQEQLPGAQCGKRTWPSPCLCADSRRGTWTGPNGSWPDETLPGGRRGSPKSDVRGQRCCSQHGQSRVKIMFWEWDELKCASTSGTSCGDLLQVSRQRLIRSTGTSWHVWPRASFSGIQRMWLLFAVQRRVSWQQRRLATSQKGQSVLALPGGSWHFTAGGGPGGWRRPPERLDH